ncbi:MAG: hypothetical protein HXM38_07435 [Isoptericola variabilis]|nr:hypothetical protein [Isoptericola variabilis]
MSNDDLRHTSDDAARTHSSDAGDDLSQLDIPALPDFGDLPGFADLPELAPLPELDALQEPAMPEIVMPDLEMPDLNQFLTVTPPAPADVPQPDAAPATGAAAAAGPTAAQTSSASHDAATASPRKRTTGKQAPRPSSTTASPRRQPAATQAPQPTVAVEPMPATTEGAPAPAQKKPHLLLTSIIWIVLISVGFSIIAPGHRESSSKPGSQPSSSRSAAQADSEVREYAADLPPRAPGYRGSATNTHSMSPQWASGVATAWTLELPSEMAHFTPQIFIDGQVLYVAGHDMVESQNDSAVRTQAYDLSGEEPTLLWDTVGPTKNSAIATYTPAFVSGENQLFFHDVVIDKATGEQTQAPWGEDFPIAQADGIVVTCSATTTCSGWTHTSGEWTNLWTTPTNPQVGYGFGNQGLGYAPKGTVLTGSGKDASVLVPTDRQQPVQILNIHTGEATILPEPGTTGTGHYVEVASDGFVVLDIGQKQGMAFDSTGAVRSRFNTGGQIFLPAVSHDDTSPSTEDLTTFLTYQRASWVRGTVDLVGNKDCSIEVTLSSDGSTRTTPVPGVLSTYMTSSCYFNPGEVRVSADGSVLYADAFAYQDKNRYFIDMSNGLTYTLPELNAMDKTMWVFDDMLIGMTKSGIKAFVPASS